MRDDTLPERSVRTARPGRAGLVPQEVPSLRVPAAVRHARGDLRRLADRARDGVHRVHARLRGGAVPLRVAGRPARVGTDPGRGVAGHRRGRAGPGRRFALRGAGGRDAPDRRGTGAYKTVGVRLLSRTYPAQTGRVLGVFDTFGTFGGVAAPAAVVVVAALPRCSARPGGRCSSPAGSRASGWQWPSPFGSRAISGDETGDEGRTEGDGSAETDDSGAEAASFRTLRRAVPETAVHRLRRGDAALFVRVQRRRRLPAAVSGQRDGPLGGAFEPAVQRAVRRQPGPAGDWRGERPDRFLCRLSCSQSASQRRAWSRFWHSRRPVVRSSSAPPSSRSVWAPTATGR